MTDADRVVMPSDAEPVLSVRGATKTFGAVVALDGVDLEVRSGEVLALLGDNGAGKSTLIKCISGVHKLDRGEIQIDGAPVQIDLGGRCPITWDRDRLPRPGPVRQPQPDGELLRRPRSGGPELVATRSPVDEAEGDVHPHQRPSRPFADPAP